MTLIVSSLSARGKPRAKAQRVVEALRAGGWSLEVQVTDSQHDIAEAARNNGDHYFGAFGGDGYLAAAAQGRAGHEGVLVPFPGGRGNDLCRHLGIGTDPVAWAQQVAAVDSSTLESWIRPLDALDVQSPDGPRLAFGIVSLGIDATANDIANHSRLQSGPLAYAWGTLQGFLGRFTPQPIRAEVDGEAVDLGGWITAISNTGWFGGGVNILPQSRTDDGEVEVINVAPVSRLRALSPLAQALIGRRVDHPLVTVMAAHEIELREPAGLAALADGDVVAHLPMKVTVVPGALAVVAPPTPKPLRSGHASGS